MRCEGYTRRGSIMSFGPPTWTQCTNDATVMLTVNQDDRTQTLPSCQECWQKVIENKIEILKAMPIQSQQAAQ